MGSACVRYQLSLDTSLPKYFLTYLKRLPTYLKILFYQLLNLPFTSGVHGVSSRKCQLDVVE